METDTGRTYSFDDLPKLNYDELIKDYGMTFLFTAPRAGGKTHLLHHLVENMHKKRKYTAAFLFSQTAFVQSGSYPYIPTKHKFDTLDELETLLFRHEAHVQNNKQKSTKHKKIRSTILIILDDIITDAQFRRHTAIQSLFIRGRHNKDDLGSLCDFVILSQNYTSVSPLVRKNSDVMVVSRQDQYSSRKQIVEGLLTVNNSRKEAYNFMRSLNETPFGFLIIQATKSNKTGLLDYCYGCVAPPKLGKFRIGGKNQWKNNVAV